MFRMRMPLVLCGLVVACAAKQASQVKMVEMVPEPMIPMIQISEKSGLPVLPFAILNMPADSEEPDEKVGEIIQRAGSAFKDKKVLHVRRVRDGGEGESTVDFYCAEGPFLHFTLTKGGQKIYTFHAVPKEEKVEVSEQRGSDSVKYEVLEKALFTENVRGFIQLFPAKLFPAHPPLCMHGLFFFPWQQGEFFRKKMEGHMGFCKCVGAYRWQDADGGYIPGWVLAWHHVKEDGGERFVVFYVEETGRSRERTELRYRPDGSLGYWERDRFYYPPWDPQGSMDSIFSDLEKEK